MNSFINRFSIQTVFVRLQKENTAMSSSITENKYGVKNISDPTLWKTILELKIKNTSLKIVCDNFKTIFLVYK